MTVTRYVNGMEMDPEDLYKLKVTNAVLENICSSVIRRAKKPGEP